MFDLNEVLTCIADHPVLAYTSVFLISLTESLALIGLLVPGTLLMFGAGAVVATGALELKPVLFSAVMGAIAGDGVSFWLGRYYGESLLRIRPFARFPGVLKNGKRFFERYGGKSILFGRFVGPVRPVIPVVSGMFGMRPLIFGLVNVLSAVGWAFVYILPGVFFGGSLAVAGAISTRLIVLIFILLVPVWGAVWLSRKLFLLAGRRGPLWAAALRDWVRGNRSANRAVGVSKRFIGFFLFRRQGEGVLLGFLVLMLCLAGWGFFGVLQDVLAKDPLVVADLSVYHFFQTLRTPLSDYVLVFVTELGDSFVNLCLFGAVLLLFLFKRCYRTAAFWTLAVLGTLCGVYLLKWLIHLPRPVDMYHGASAYGFPSGHTTMSVVLYGFIALLISRGLSSRIRGAAFAGVLLVTFMIAFSRLYLGAHWLSDVLGGLFIGTIWIALLGIFYLKGRLEKVPRRLLGFVLVLVMAAAGGWHVAKHHEKDLTIYAPRREVRYLQLSAWLAGDWRTLPAWRIDMAGIEEQPLTIQWTGPGNELGHCLMTLGWRIPPALTLKNCLAMLSMQTRIEQLPVLPKLHDGRFESLRLMRRVRGGRWLLRLWPEDVKIAGSRATSVFVGTIETQHSHHLAGLVTVAEDTGEYDRTVQALRKMLQNRFALQPVSRNQETIQDQQEHQGVHWNGGVLLVWDRASG